MKIEKRDNGKYRIRQMENGRTYSVTLDFKPTDKQAFQIMQDKINNRIDLKKPFYEACEEYISVKSNVLSPSTLKGYDSVMRMLPKWFTSLDVAEIDNYALQKLVNEHSLAHAPKSTRNMYGFVTGVLRLFYPDKNISATLPQKRSTEPYTPSLDDVKALFEYSKGTHYYIGFRLASMSLRRSEICALEITDLDDNDILHINKALVLDKNNKWIVKPTGKTDASNRIIVLPHDLAEQIREQGYIFKGYPNTFDTYLRRNLPKMGIPIFSLHKLRHFFASYSHDLGYSDAQIQEMGGWNSDVMKKVYRHAMRKDEAMRAIASDFNL